MPDLHLFFHLNLAFSSIAESARVNVIDRCYEPLLDLADHHGFPVGVEMSGWTLEQIATLRPKWIERFRKLVHAGKCELIGSGYVQLAGPLVPHQVNTWNQTLGKKVYEKVIGVSPKLALVNEMAYSAGLIPIYLKAGYEGIILDADNARLAQGGTGSKSTLPCIAADGTGNQIAVLWAESISMQKFQRCVHGDITFTEYVEYLGRKIESARGPLALYSSDAEIFDFRPGRFKEEPGSKSGEWKRLTDLLEMVRQKKWGTWVTPGTACRNANATQLHGEANSFTSAAHPILVKKQAKYNLVRWAVAGRDNLWLNTKCHAALRAWNAEKNPDSQKRLCEWWASDFRTHIEEARWKKLRAEISAAKELTTPAPSFTLEGTKPNSPNWPSTIRLTIESEGRDYHLESAKWKVVLNQKKGFTFSSIAFASHGFEPVIGLLPQGYFESSKLGVDWFSGGLVVESTTEHRRLTDLNEVTPQFFTAGNTLYVVAQIETTAGKFQKVLRLDSETENISLKTEVIGFEHVIGSIRVAQLTLLPEAFPKPLFVESFNGGYQSERFEVSGDFNHGAPVSGLVSSHGGLGATTGEIFISDAARGVKLAWDPSRCAALPLLKHLTEGAKSLTRVTFSLREMDDTSKAGGHVLPFEITISPTLANRVNA